MLTLSPPFGHQVFPDASVQGVDRRPRKEEEEALESGLRD